MKKRWSLVLVAAGLGLSAAVVPAEVVSQTAQVAIAPAVETKQQAWKSFITPADLKRQLEDENLLVIDVRSAEEYAANHIPGAINIPGADWRTPSAKPGKGDSQYIFRAEDGSPDIARYEKLLSDAGVTREHKVVVYGSHAGKADGSIPAMLLLWLGHPEVTFLDGMGLSEWQAAGYTTTAEPHTLAATNYKAEPTDGFVWNLDDVKKHIGDDKVVFYDTRSPGEYAGTDLRSNKHGGRIPGAVLCDYAEFLDKDKRTLGVAEIESKLKERGITPDKQIVLYCQTATRVSLPYLALRDLGYTNISIYDASWHEYGNRDDTAIERDEPAANAAE